MRTTVTLDPDAHVVVKRLMRERSIGFKQALNDAIRAGGAEPNAPYETPIFDMGVPRVNLDKALQLSGQMEDDYILAKMAKGR